MRQLLVCVAGLLLSSALIAQSSPVKVEFENEQIRVSRLKLAPGQTLAMASWMPEVQVPLTSNEVIATCKGMSAFKVRTSAGLPKWSPGGECAVTNGEAPFETVIVELKNAKEPARPLLSAPLPQPAKYLEEPFHRWAFENQYVRVFDVHIPPGATTEYHLHALDTVFVQVSDEDTEQQPQGQGWESPSKSVAGTVDYSADLGKERTHRVRNRSSKEYHVIAIQLLP